MIISRVYRKLGRRCLAASFGLIVLTSRADVVELVNGDRYQGTVVSMTEGFLDFQSEIQGRVKLPRAKVATITLHSSIGSKPAAKTTISAPFGSPIIVAGNNGTSAPASQADAVIQQMRREGIDPKMINQVQEQIFGKASPEASQKFNQTMAGLMSGRLSMGDIRLQAQDSINQIRDAKKELGGDADEMLDGYLAILEQFVQQTGNGEAGSVPIQRTPATPAESGARPMPPN